VTSLMVPSEKASAVWLQFAMKLFELRSVSPFGGIEVILYGVRSDTTGPGYSRRTIRFICSDSFPVKRAVVPQYMRYRQKDDSLQCHRHDHRYSAVSTVGQKLAGATDIYSLLRFGAWAMEIPYLAEMDINSFYLHSTLPLSYLCCSFGKLKIKAVRTVRCIHRSCYVFFEVPLRLI